MVSGAHQKCSLISLGSDVYFSSEILYYLLLQETSQEYIMVSLPLATSPVQFKYLASLWAMTVFPLAGIPTNATIKGPNFF